MSADVSYEYVSAHNGVIHARIDGRSAYRMCDFKASSLNGGLGDGPFGALMGMYRKNHPGHAVRIYRSAAVPGNTGYYLFGEHQKSFIDYCSDPNNRNLAKIVFFGGIRARGAKKSDTKGQMTLIVEQKKVIDQLLAANKALTEKIQKLTGGLKPRVRVRAGRNIIEMEETKEAA